MLLVVRSKLHSYSKCYIEEFCIPLPETKKDKLVTIKDKAYYIVLILKYNNVNKQISLLCDTDKISNKYIGSTTCSYFCEMLRK